MAITFEALRFSEAKGGSHRRIYFIAFAGRGPAEAPTSLRLPVPASSMFIWHDVVCHSGASVCFAGKYCSNNGERIWVWGVLTRGVRTNKKRLGGPDLKREAHDPDF